MIDVDSETFTIKVDHLGFTLRTLLGAADTAARDLPVYRRKWNIEYKGVKIGNFQLAFND